MARSVIAITTAVQAGIIATLDVTDSSNDHEFFNPVGGVVLILVNGLTAAGTTIVTTIISVADPYGRTGDLTCPSSATGTVMIAGPFPPLLFNQTDDTVQVDVSASDAQSHFIALRVNT